MTGLNHAVTGALVAAFINEPLIALPAAFASHFVIDMIPHWNYRVPGGLRSKHVVMLADLILSIVLISVFALNSTSVPGWQVLAGGFLGIAPDLMWLPYFLTGKESKIHKNTPLHLTRRLHLNIQWSESDTGLLVEAAWLFIALILASQIL
jgi:hypothetical protein